MHSDHQRQFNIRRSAWAGDESNGALQTRSLEVLAQQRKQLIESTNDLLGSNQRYVDCRQQ